MNDYIEGEVYERRKVQPLYITLKPLYITFKQMY